MTGNTTDKAFSGSIPRLYETYLVPMIFASYANDMARRLSSMSVSNLLEIAAGTGVVTRALASTLPEAVSIVATDLNQAMLDEAALAKMHRAVTWRQADAMALPFPDGAFDVVVCQFGAMFFPDKAKAFSEARRVLRPGGKFIFNVWDKLSENEFADVVSTALEPLFPDDPPRFLVRAPHGYYDHDVIRRDLARAGFTASPRIDTLTARSAAATAKTAAMAYCQGTPLRSEIEARDSSKLEQATDIAADALVKRFGAGAVEGKIQAHVVSVERD